MAKTVKAVGYLRVSGRGQVRGDGFTRQRKAIERYAKSHRLELVAEYRDEGVSGTTGLADRPALLELYQRLLDNGVRKVIVEKTDRLYRDLVQGELILAEFRDNGVQVLTSDGTDLTTGDDSPTAVLVRQVLGAIAQFDKSTTVQKLRAARRRKRAATGRCEGRKPFGLHDGEAKTLAELKRLRRKPRGKKRPSYQAVADAANRLGLSTRTGVPWTRARVFAVLTR